jgi:hypothetical protein
MKGVANMGTPATAAKQRWNKKNYVQVKVSVKPDIAQSFKSSCASEGVSMAGKIAGFMAGKPCAPAAKKESRCDLSTRKKRRKNLAIVISTLESIRDAEEEYFDNIPTNLKGSMAADDAASAISLLDDAICILGDVY